MADKGFSVLLQDLVVCYSAKFILLLETHVSGAKALKLIKKFLFDGYCINKVEFRV